MAEHGRQEQKIEILKNIIKENQHKSRITLLRTTSTNSANPEVHPQRIFRPTTQLHLHPPTTRVSYGIE